MVKFRGQWNSQRQVSLGGGSIMLTVMQAKEEGN